MIDNLSKFDTLQNKWADLSTNNPFSNFHFVSSWIKNYLPPKAVLNILEDEKAIAPFYRLGNTLFWLGKGMANYMGVLAADQDKEEFWQNILGNTKKYNIYLNGIKKDTPTEKALLKLGFKIAKSVACPITNIPDTADWDSAYKSILKNKRRYELRKTEEYLENKGSLLVENTPGKNLTEAQIQKIFALFKKRWAHRYGAEEAGKERFNSFQKEVLKNHPDTYVSLLYLNKELISFIYGFYAYGHFVDYIVAFDPELQRISVGNYHIKLLMEDLYKKGLKTFDFSIGDEIYKRKWANSEFVVEDLYLSRTMGSKIYIFWLRIRELLKKYLRKPVRSILGKFK
ncbi:GNAT family N-acetyltransferase [Candidatus Margulisiibacteriota bacterium]